MKHPARLRMKAGEAVRFRLRVRDPETLDAVPLGSVVVRFVARARPTDADPPVIDLSTTNAGVAIVDAPNGIAEIRFTTATTSTVAPGTYEWDCAVVDASGPEVVASGLLTIKPAIIR